MRKLFLSLLLVAGLTASCDADSQWELDQQDRIAALETGLNNTNRNLAQIEADLLATIELLKAQISENANNITANSELIERELAVLTANLNALAATSAEADDELRAVLASVEASIELLIVEFNNEIELLNEDLQLGLDSLEYDFNQVILDLQAEIDATLVAANAYADANDAVGITSIPDFGSQITTVQNNLDGLSDVYVTIEDFNAAIKDLQTLIDTKADGDEMTRLLNVLSTGLKAYADAQDIATAFDDSELRRIIGNIDTALDSLSSYINRSYESWEEDQVLDMNEILDAIDAAIAAAAFDDASIQAKLTQLRLDVNANAVSIQVLKDALDALTAQVNSLTTSSANFITIEGLYTALISLEGQIQDYADENDADTVFDPSALQAQIDTLKTTLSNLETVVSNIDEIVQNLENDFTALLGRVSALETNGYVTSGELSAQIAAITTNLQNYADANDADTVFDATQLEADIAALEAAVAAAEEAIDDLNPAIDLDIDWSIDATTNTTVAYSGTRGTSAGQPIRIIGNFPGVQIGDDVLYDGDLYQVQALSVTNSLGTVFDGLDLGNATRGYNASDVWEVLSHETSFTFNYTVTENDIPEGFSYLVGTRYSGGFTERVSGIDITSFGATTFTVQVTKPNGDVEYINLTSTSSSIVADSGSAVRVFTL